MIDGKPAPAQGGRQGAQVRGDIQKGMTGDKVPGFDPAAAPMETDAEAAGTREPMPSYDGLDVHAAASNPGANASSHGNAMRPFDKDKPDSTHLGKILIAGGAALIVILLLLFLT